MPGDEAEQSERAEDLCYGVEPRRTASIKTDRRYHAQTGDGNSVDEGPPGKFADGRASREGNRVGLKCGEFSRSSMDHRSAGLAFLTRLGLCGRLLPYVPRRILPRLDF